MATPDRVKRTPTLFGKHGALAPWFAGVAGSAILYFRVSHLDPTPSVFLLAPLKAAPVLVLSAISKQLVAFGAVESYATAIGRGLLCSAVGDVLLELEDAFSLDALFIGGLVSFLVGHCFYISAFSSTARREDVRAAAAPVVAYALGLSAYLSAYLPALLVGPVLLYAAVIAAMALSSLCRALALPDFASRCSYYSGVAGALVFVVSDSVLAVNKFAFAVPAAHGVVMATYYLGQLLITLSVWGARAPVGSAPSAEGGRSKAD
eukprot:CAMPEP_0182814940 /NCGR_PEP_ID=MMETSP0006_2-20121128/10125_1 /TAXON_ID=97485 /ORGANISM="Prymnesium parvum, Strain Texoma1" /LENGTH=262 /DNA_ID=CAMNT_0024941105 /DNA_START=3 /DNA_END=791 /DNA_ORIENTATION=-